jgi:hypothetical protein
MMNHRSDIIGRAIHRKTATRQQRHHPMEGIILKRLVVCFAAALLGCSLNSQTPPDNPPSESELAKISARGRALAGYDDAAWHASDAVMPLKPVQAEVQVYVARSTETGWVVDWGRYNETRTKFLIVYEAEQTANPTEYRVTKHDPPVEDSDAILRAAKAHDLAMAEFLRDTNPKRPYNISILPAPSGDWYVYAIPAQTDTAVLPYGGDDRYTVSADGSKIIEKRQMHKIVLEEKLNKPEFNFHTHVLSDLPEDSDVFYALTRKAIQGEWVCTKKFVYGITADGSLNNVGRTEDVIKLLLAGKAEVITGPYRAMVLASLKRLVDSSTAINSLEAYVSYLGARCTNNTLFMNVSIIVHNNSDTRIILYKNALRDSQARFAPTDEDILAGKYEKLVYMTPQQIDISDQHSFMVIGPGMNYAEEREFPINLGLDSTDKSSMQFLFFTWPETQKADAETARARFAQFGSLYTGTILSSPAPLTVDPKLSKTCKSK